MTKKFILNADDFGLNEANNRAILEGYNYGILKSASLVSNGEAFDDAIGRIIPACEDLGVGIHLNITEGKSLLENLTELTDENGYFKNSYSKIILKLLNPKNTSFLNQTEQEFRAQIEKVKNLGIEITHIDSHSHIHAIPPIFNLVCKLAKEYGINQVRTHFEKPYIIPDIFIHLNKKYPINLLKLLLLNIFTIINYPALEKFGLKTNDYIIGITYTSLMNSLTVYYGLKSIKSSNLTAETIIRPKRYEDGIIDNYFTEYQVTKNEKLKKEIKKMGFEIGNYKN